MGHHRRIKRFTGARKFEREHQARVERDNEKRAQLEVSFTPRLVLPTQMRRA